MKPLLNRWRYAALCSLIVCLSAAVACSEAAPGSSERNQTDAELEILFPKMYSA